MSVTLINADAVIEEFGAHYVPEGQNMSNLLIRPFEAFGTRDAFTNVPTNATQLRFSDVEVGEILQPYQDDFTPKGSVTFEPVTIDLQPVKIDVKINPSNLIYSWLGFLTSNKTDRSEWPFTKWLIEVYILQQLFEDLEMKAIYKGVKAAVVAGTPGAAAAILNGVEKIINLAIAGGQTSTIATGAFSTDPVTFCEQIEAFAESIPEKYWNKPMTINMSRTLARRYAKGKRKKYNMYHEQEGDLMTIADAPSLRVVGRASMQGKSKIWATPVANAIFATKGFENTAAFELEKVDRNVKIFSDFHIGLGFLQNDLIFTNDRELV